MSDVRLTALNPDDSSPVPVACDAAGKLLLEDVPAFDGNLDGDLTVTGSGKFEKFVWSDRATGTDTAFYATENGSETINIRADGSADFSGPLSVDGGETNEDATYGTGYIITNRSAPARNLFTGKLNGTETCHIRADGTAQFASDKAGITTEGYFWCTTRRGHTVILDSTSNGMANWVEYEHSSRRDVLKDQVEEWAEKDTNDPDFGVSPEDNPET